MCTNEQTIQQQWVPYVNNDNLEERLKLPVSTSLPAATDGVAYVRPTISTVDTAGPADNRAHSRGRLCQKRRRIDLESGRSAPFAYPTLTRLIPPFGPILNVEWVTIPKTRKYREYRYMS